MSVAAEAEGAPHQPLPLGLRADFPLSDAQRAALVRLAGFDLQRIRARLLQEQVVPPEWVDASLLEFRRFVALRVLAPGRLLGMPSPAVDEVWHIAILHTRLYHELCSQVLGAYLHHEPLDATNEAETGGVSFAEFRALYEQAFGPLSPLWRVRWGQEEATE